MQDSNFTQSLKDQGLRTPSELIYLYDVDAMGGGRINNKLLAEAGIGTYLGVYDQSGGPRIGGIGGVNTAMIQQLARSIRGYKAAEGIPSAASLI
jgi:hypothetical protein